jgi:Zn-dependent protease with chaperone function
MSQEATLPPPAGSADVAFRIDGPIPPRKVPLVYTITLALTAFAMVLLPVLYVALIVAAGYGLKYYAIHATAIFAVRLGWFWILLVYLAPLIAGSVMIAFMVKPLFARPAQREGGYLIDLDQEPRLREVITAICRQVGVPVPAEVRVDCQPNASAGLRRGLLSVGRKDLVLTIGLPLAGQLTARQLAGVLAHEFGHFRQGAGMAFTYLINTINHWFARVVFERDSWDEALTDHARDADSRIGLVLWTAQGAVWLSRRILFLFMQLGRMITCLQSRQMEYDADYYEAALAGTDTFNETARELRRLSAAGQVAMEELGQLWHSRQLFDDFPAYVALRRTQFTYEEIGKIDGAAIKERAGWFDTHPTEVERGTRVRALKLPGLFRGDAPATALFQDFAALSREATLHFYREQLQLTFEAESIIPTTSAAQVSEDITTAEAARLKLLGTLLTPMRPILWAHGDFGPPVTEPVGVISAQLTALEAQIAGLRLEAEPHHAAYHTLREEIGQAKVAQAFHSGEVVVQSGTFTLDLCNLPHTERRLSELTARIATRRDSLAPLEATFHAWACLVGRAARTPDFAAQLP